MFEEDKGGPAFPEMSGEKIGEVGEWRSSPGMTLCDYFAAAAMTGLIANGTDGPSASVIQKRLNEENITIFQLFAETAYKYANAMIEKRNKIND